MKKYFYLLAIATAALFACTKEPSTQEPSSSQQKLTFTGITDDGLTKTTLGSDFTIVWSTQDDITVFPGENAAGVQFDVTATAREGREATFEGTASSASTYYALSPAQSSATIADGKITASIPTTQTATAGSFAPEANIAVASATDYVFQFKNVGALIGVTVGNDGITGIKLESLSGEALTGTAVINPDGSLVSKTGKSYAKLTGSFNNGSTYYFVVLPGTYTGGFRITLNKGTQYTSFKKTDDKTLERNENLTLGTLTGSKWKNIISAGEDITVQGSAVTSPDVAGTRMRYSTAFYNSSVTNYGDRIDALKGPVGYDYEIFIKLSKDTKFYFSTASGHLFAINSTGDQIENIFAEADIDYNGVSNDGVYRIRINSATNEVALRRAESARYLQPNRGTNQQLNYAGNGTWVGYPVFGWTNPKGWGTNSIFAFKFQIYYNEVSTWQFYGRYETESVYTSRHIQPITDTSSPGSWDNILTVENDPVWGIPYQEEYGYCDMYLILNADGYTYDIRSIRK